jgi:ADP-heptose:LPS heptosyltransferase
MLAVIAGSRVVATVDSFGSHVAQLAASRHVALMSHDLPVHTVHPAAPSEIVFEAMPCVPCHYVNRDMQVHCMAGREWCGVFASPSYLVAARRALDRALATP